MTSSQTVQRHHFSNKSISAAFLLRALLRFYCRIFRQVRFLRSVVLPDTALPQRGYYNNSNRSRAPRRSAGRSHALFPSGYAPLSLCATVPIYAQRAKKCTPFIARRQSVHTRTSSPCIRVDKCRSEKNVSTPPGAVLLAYLACFSFPPCSSASRPLF